MSNNSKTPDVLAADYRRAIDNTADREMSADAATVALFMADRLQVIADTAEQVHAKFAKDSARRNRVLTVMRNSLARACKLQGADKLTVKRIEGRYVIAPAASQDGGNTAKAEAAAQVRVLEYVASHRADPGFIAKLTAAIRGE